MLNLLLAAALLSADAPASAAPKAAPPQSAAPAAETWLSPVGLKVGDKGKIRWTAKVEEVINANTIIAQITEAAVPSPGVPLGAVIKRVDPPSARLWIVGVDTKKIEHSGKVVLSTGKIIVKDVTSAKTADGNDSELLRIVYTPTPMKPKPSDGPNKAK